MFKKILIANRGEIACRIMRTANRMGVECVAVFSEADRNAMHVRMAQEAICVGSAASADSYLRVDRVLDAAQKSGAQAIHPGYGFLSENAAFADAVRVAGLSFIGPPAQAMRDMGAKDASKRLMEEAEVPLLPGYHGVDQSLETLRLESEKCGLGEGQNARTSTSPPSKPSSMASGASLRPTESRTSFRRPSRKCSPRHRSSG